MVRPMLKFKRSRCRRTNANADVDTKRPKLKQMPKALANEAEMEAKKLRAGTKRARDEATTETEREEANER